MRITKQRALGALLLGIYTGCSGQPWWMGSLLSVSVALMSGLIWEDRLA